VSHGPWAHGRKAQTRAYHGFRTRRSDHNSSKVQIILGTKLRPNVGSCTYTQNMITPDTMLDTSIPPTSKLQTDPKTRAPHTPKAQIRFSVRCSNLSAAGIHPGAGFRSAGKDQLASLSRRPSQAGTKPIASSWWGRSPPLGTTLSRAEQMPQPWVRFGVRPQP
jgi:hypothetical protein